MELAVADAADAITALVEACATEAADADAASVAFVMLKLDALIWRRSDVVLNQSHLSG